MLPETGETPEGSEGHEVPFGERDQRAGEEGTGGVSESHSDGGDPGYYTGGDCGDEGGDEAPESGPEAEGKITGHGRETGEAKRPRKKRVPNLSEAQITEALTRTCGDRASAAALLGCNTGTINIRISKSPRLLAVWGANVEGAPIPELDEATAMRRDEYDIPTTADLNRGVELMSRMGPEAQEQHRRALAAFGIREDFLDRLKSLEELAPDVGAAIALTLQKTHISYYGQLMALAQMGSDIQQNYLQPGTETPMELVPFFQKNYIELVKEQGRGVQIFAELAQVIIKMMEAYDGTGKPAAKKVGKPAW